MQVIDASQCRTPDRLRPDEKAAWARENKDVQCYDHIRSLVAQTQPDMIFITGDVVYGQFDDSGDCLKDFIAFMESLQIPWTLVYGNHDNESAIGVARQSEMYAAGTYCMFKRGNVTGNSNFSIGITCGGELKRVFYMVDSNGCVSQDPEVVRERGIYPDQIAQIEEKAEALKTLTGKTVPGFMAFHIPVDCFLEAEQEKGYGGEVTSQYILGVDTVPKDGDFGFRLEKCKPLKTDGNFKQMLHRCGIDGVFVGHCHSISTCILYDSIRWVFGLKTGQYDYHIPGQLGGTLVTLSGTSNTFAVRHIPALVPQKGFPGSAPMWNGFFAGSANST